ncbi:hypothetical protein C0995_014431, partial [Termitomyces sp. Mi166
MDLQLVGGFAPKPPTNTMFHPASTKQSEHEDLNPEDRPLDQARAQGILQGWEQQHQADLEEDFNGLNPQNDIPPEEELEYVDAPPLGQIVENALEYLQQPVDNGDDPRQDDPPDDPAIHIPAEEVEPPLDPAISEM